MNNRPMSEQNIQGLWGHFYWLGVLAEQGSYTAAAARLGVSKAAVSQRIAELVPLGGVVSPIIQNKISASGIEYRLGIAQLRDTINLK